MKAVATALVPFVLLSVASLAQPGDSDPDDKHLGKIDFVNNSGKAVEVTGDSTQAIPTDMDETVDLTIEQCNGSSPGDGNYELIINFSDDLSKYV